MPPFTWRFSQSTLMITNVVDSNQVFANVVDSNQVFTNVVNSNHGLGVVLVCAGACAAMVMAWVWCWSVLVPALPWSWLGCGAGLCWGLCCHGHGLGVVLAVRGLFVVCSYEQHTAQKPLICGLCNGAVLSRLLCFSSR